MRKMKLCSLFLVIALLLSAFCACDIQDQLEDGLEVVKVDANVDRMITDIFDAFVEKDSEKMAVYFWVPQELKGEAYIDKAIHEEAARIIMGWRRADLGTLKNIKYTSCKTSSNQEGTETISTVAFILTFEEEKYEGEIKLLIDSSGSACSGIQFLLIENVLETDWKWEIEYFYL